MIAAVALTLILPVAGLVLSLAVITLLRAADHAQSALAARRSVRGPRPSDLLVVVVTAPLSVLRALLTEALMAPLAFIVGAAVYIATLALTRSLELPRAGAYAAAAIVAWYGVGPGSGRPRRQLNRMASVAARTPLTAAVTALAVWALAAGAVDLRGVAGPLLLAGDEPRTCRPCTAGRSSARTCPGYTERPGSGCPGWEACSRRRRTGCSGTLAPDPSPGPRRPAASA